MYRHLKSLLLFSGVAFFASFIMRVEANESSIIQIKTNVEEIYTESAEVEVSVECLQYREFFGEDQIYLSYHVYDSDGELVRFESTRTPILFEENAFSSVISIDLNGINKGERELFCTFDIVNESQGYWVSENGSYELQGTRIRCLLSGGERLKKRIINEIFDSAGVFGLNCVVTVIFTVLFLKVKKQFSIL